MSDAVATEGTAGGISTNEIQSAQVGRADAPDLAQRVHSKLRDFLKKNLQSLGVAQIMIGLKCFLFGIIEIFLYWHSDFRNLLFCFYIGYPFWAAASFIMSGSLTISCTRKQTKFLIEVSIGANIISTLLSSTGIILLSVNLVDIVLLECWELPACSLVKSFITNIVILQMILTCVQIFISFSLCGLTYTVDGNEISWASALSCLIRSHSEDPYQDLLTQPETYEDLVLQDIDQVHSHP
ncbi:high affinity immunoglobulin epsilon receptor subunit beta-like isoform X2 [Neofelis nebulosa]|uniref:high affinity immunoglobulin epsilon receptor subunit beta-like isoform X2 n=1 Tax=Neofelis nebulosa TaxID=61452 RepID=UPI00272DB09C|nr:high affinity immunoglobulin epsilon receptor subunit beta-like isoform X2 [Neofelis nebulosa]XP_058545122.1 high affinity immunoglobulin epsilon receptor subunit beta-like isoform X2 [Neofelis nebulosa]XP_058545123.1 high affinity immunoglobulin epsilon receptor subunit beta-like isoform X2 [Neofelis nebulosa]